MAGRVTSIHAAANSDPPMPMHIGPAELGYFGAPGRGSCPSDDDIISLNTSRNSSTVRSAS